MKTTDLGKLRHKKAPAVGILGEGRVSAGCGVWGVALSCCPSVEPFQTLLSLLRHCWPCHPSTTGVLKTKCTFFSTLSRFLVGIGLGSARLPDRLFPWVTLGGMLSTPGPVPGVYLGYLLSGNDSLQTQNAPSLTSQF